MIMICCKNELIEKQAVSFLLPWMFCKAVIKSLPVCQSLQLSVLSKLMKNKLVLHLTSLIKI